MSSHQVWTAPKDVCLCPHRPQHDDQLPAARPVAVQHTLQTYSLQWLQHTDTRSICLTCHPTQLDWQKLHLKRFSLLLPGTTFTSGPRLPHLVSKPAQPVLLNTVLLLPCATPLAHPHADLLQTPTPPPVDTLSSTLQKAREPAGTTKRKCTRTVTSNTCRKCGQFRTTETGHSQLRGKIFCPKTKKMTTEEWLQSMCNMN